ncbi:MAG: hypothetical protein M3R13_07930 [Armatimonadota bacterium]|nr:hypothetical protein [Armatimonadota bacterium]
MKEEKKVSERAPKSCGCDIDIKIDSQGDVNIYNCTKECGDKKRGPSSQEECKPPRTEGACVPLGLGCKPKQSRRKKLETLLAKNKVPSALAASFFQTARRFLNGNEPANDFEQATFPTFSSMSPELQDILRCTVDSFETTPSDIKNAGLNTSITADPDKPVDTATLSSLIIKEIEQRGADLVFGNPNALESERPGLNRFFDPQATGSDSEFLPAQLLICRVNDLRTSKFRPPLTIGDYLPAEIQQQCELILVNGSDPENSRIDQVCDVQTTDCPGNVLPDNVCARVPDVANGDTVVVTGCNFMSVDMKVKLTARTGSGLADVDAFVFGDLETPLNEEINGATKIIQDCRVKDRLTFVVPEDLPPGIYEMQLVLPNTTGIAFFGPTILSNTEFINILPPLTARFQIVAERMRARAETSPASFGSDEVGLLFLSSELKADGTIGPIQRLSKSFGDVDSSDSRDIDAPIFLQSQDMVGMALTIVGYEIDSERAFNQQITSFSAAFVDYLERAWDKFRAELAGGAAAVIKAIGLIKGAIVVAIAAILALAIIAVVARWAPADLIMDDAIGFSVIDLAELTNANVPSPGFGHFDSPQGLEINLTPLEKGALTYREFREYVADDEDSRYEIFFQYNRTA